MSAFSDPSDPYWYNLPHSAWETYNKSDTVSSNIHMPEDGTYVPSDTYSEGGAYSNVGTISRYTGISSNIYPPYDTYLRAETYSENSWDTDGLTDLLCYTPAYSSFDPLSVGYNVPSAFSPSKAHNSSTTPKVKKPHSSSTTHGANKPHNSSTTPRVKKPRSSSNTHSSRNTPKTKSSRSSHKLGTEAAKVKDATKVKPSEEDYQKHLANRNRHQGHNQDRYR